MTRRKTLSHSLRVSGCRNGRQRKLPSGPPETADAQASDTVATSTEVSGAPHNPSKVGPGDARRYEISAYRCPLDECPKDSVTPAQFTRVPLGPQRPASKNRLFEVPFCRAHRLQHSTEERRQRAACNAFAPKSSRIFGPGWPRSSLNDALTNRGPAR